MALEGKRIALLAEDLYEDVELWYPYYRLQEAGAVVVVVGPEANTVYKSKHGLPVQSALAARDLQAADFDAVIIPGGYAPDRMRRDQGMIKFVKHMAEAGKVVAYICHAGWLAISAGIVQGRQVTGFFSTRDDLVNAGATYLDKAVVRDGNLISSRKPDDLPVFCRTIIAALE